MRFGVYISGPGIVGRMLMDCGGSIEPRPMVFDTREQAEAMAVEIRPIRPYHHIRVLMHEDGDELRGSYAAHPDGVT